MADSIPDVLNLSIVRQDYTSKSTLGEMLLEAQHLAWTLEDTCRRTKIYGETAIPAGKYEIVPNYWAKYSKKMPLLTGVPGYEGIYIHPGNFPRDTFGCILVGRTKGVDMVGESRFAFAELMKIIEPAFYKKKIYLTITGGFTKEQFDWKV